MHNKASFKDDITFLIMNIRKHTRIYALLSVLVLTGTTVSGSMTKSAMMDPGSMTKSVWMNPAHWNTQNAVSFVDFEGRKSLQMKGTFQKGGIAEVKDFEFTDGTIEFDMWIVFEKAMFAGLEFRYNDAQEASEYIYFRPASNNQKNAFQYSPHYNGESAWQLYGHHQRKVDLPQGEWFHVKIEVKGQQMACFIHNQEFPFFYTDNLDSGSKSGSIRFDASSEYYVSNLKIVQSTSTCEWEFNPADQDLDPAYLTTWSVSKPVSLQKDQKKLSLDAFSFSNDSIITAEDRGLISFTRYYKNKGGHSALLAERTFTSDIEQNKKLDLGYSDRIDLYLNGELVFEGDNTYRTKSSKMGSRVHLGNDTVELKLTKGENILQAIVYERFGGQGMIAKFKNLQGIQK